MAIPCNCCSLNLTKCKLPIFAATCPLPATQVTQPVTSPIPNTQLIANPQNLAISNPPLSRTADGNNAGGSFSGFTSGNNTVTFPQNIIVDYVYATIQDRVLNIRLWNNGGGVLTDQDGLSNATIAELYDNSGTLIFAGNLAAGNGGGVFVTNVSAFPGLDGVKRLRLRNLRRQVASTVSPIWRDINLQLAYESTITWTCGDLVVTALVQGTLGNLTIGATNLVQTNGPHTMTFAANFPFNGTITTNRPADFSTLAVTNGTVVTVTGNHNSTFAISYTYRDDSRHGAPAFSLLCDGQVKWYDSETNNELTAVQVADLIDC